LGWLCAALAVHLALQQRWFPAALKYLSTAADLLLLTALLGVADGPRSPLVVGYFLILVLSGLRFSLGLVRFATILAMAAYLALSGYEKWFAEAVLTVPRYHQLIFLLALALTGVVSGQILRRSQEAADEFAARLESQKGERP
jgi:hypothetical protein